MQQYSAVQDQSISNRELNLQNEVLEKVSRQRTQDVLNSLFRFHTFVTAAVCTFCLLSIYLSLILT